MDQLMQRVNKNFDHLWYSMMATISLSTSPHKFVCPVLSGYCKFWFDLLHASTCNRSTCCMLSTCFSYTYEQRNLRFLTRLDHWLFQDSCQIAESADVGLTVHSASGLADNKYCFNLVLLGIFNFLFLYWSLRYTSNQKAVMLAPWNF